MHHKINASQRIDPSQRINALQSLKKVLVHSTQFHDITTQLEP